jgi:hypothetical protein
MHMKLVPLSQLSVDSYMTKPELRPISLDDLLTAVTMNWREQISLQSSAAYPVSSATVDINALIFSVGA